MDKTLNSLTLSLTTNNLDTMLDLEKNVVKTKL